MQTHVHLQNHVSCVFQTWGVERLLRLAAPPCYQGYLGLPCMYEAIQHLCSTLQQLLLLVC